LSLFFLVVLILTKTVEVRVTRESRRIGGYWVVADITDLQEAVLLAVSNASPAVRDDLQDSFAVVFVAQTVVRYSYTHVVFLVIQGCSAALVMIADAVTTVVAEVTVGV
jgi:hypothetical protein